MERKGGMDMGNGATLAVAAGGLIVLIAMATCGKPLRRLLTSGTQGLCTLVVVNLTGAFTGISLGLGLFSGLCCLLLGAPGVILLLFLKVIFGV